MVSLNKLPISFFEVNEFLIKHLLINYSLICNICIEIKNCFEVLYSKIVLLLNNINRDILMVKILVFHDYISFVFE